MGQRVWYMTHEAGVCEREMEKEGAYTTHELGECVCVCEREGERERERE